MNAAEIAASILAEIEVLVGAEPISCYRLAQIIGVRPQMMYNYRAKHLLVTRADGLVDSEVAVAFAMKRAMKVLA